MKKILLICLILSPLAAQADSKIVALDMELGYWETDAEMLESEAITQMMASMPEAQRAQMQAMMKSKMKIPTIKQCITKDSFENFEEKFKESMGGKNDCGFKIEKSTSQEFLGSLNAMGIALQFTLSSQLKRQVSDVVSSAGGAGLSKIRTTAKWVSSDCPRRCNTLSTIYRGSICI